MASAGQKETGDADGIYYAKPHKMINYTILSSSKHTSCHKTARASKTPADQDPNRALKL